MFLPQTGWTPAGRYGVGLVAVTFALAAFAARAGDLRDAFAALDTARHLAPLDPEAHDSIESARLRWLERRGRR